MTIANKSEHWIQRGWYGNSPLMWLLLPLSWLFLLLVLLRSGLYKAGLLKSVRFDVPVIVIGNLTVGGTGKTPVTIWLCQQLQKRGYSPGIVSRGYGGQVGPQPIAVFAASDTAVVGDEPVLMARRTNCPIVVHPDRVAATAMLVGLGVNIVLADDGLQHLRLHRDYEVAVVDGERGYGNGHLLPAGPLREPLSRLASINQVVEQSGHAKSSSVFRRAGDGETLRFELLPEVVRSLDDGESRSIADFSGQKVHAVAAIGNPHRFFRSLRDNGIEVIEHPLRDHATLDILDITFPDDLPVMMTEKDAVKCREFGSADCWYVSVELDFEESRGDAWLDSLEQRFPLKGKAAP